MTAIIALLLHPEAQHRAQADLDAVTGRVRLPTFEDRASLPYIDAICREAQRWQAVTPLSVYHTVSKDDVYEGMLIPKGVNVIPNAWYVLTQSTAVSVCLDFGDVVA